ncbi:MAG: hypothetical protein KJO05_08265 [Bacteroidia bacterium]|nr:hypothetical protein [Bacteroidia bacterium]NNF31535.1 hypothetical protein [Flavobacteriaceae bacterium]MBT8275610.1 hypothetical protein [Bacteroidia bacterium]NNJ82800.1 hypothetical protein [Flavobacteriaceae bacterium]NNK54114.1 hypothetical protein [Flavobacteriaceae bacterium]
MKRDLPFFLIKLIGITALLFGIHYYVFTVLFSDIVLYFPLWVIYLFNAGLVLLVFLIIRIQMARGYTKTYNLFLILTISKMALAIVFLLPLFAGKAENAVVDVSNFFIPYFLFLVFEIFQLNIFFKKEETN